MRTYDVLFIVSPQVGDDGVAPLVEELRTCLKDGGATFLDDSSWGRRRLAYDIGTDRDGHYHCFRVNAGTKAIAELERRMRLSEHVIRSIAVRIDEDLKHQVKIDKTKKVRTPPPSAAVESAPVGDAPAEA